MWVLFCTLGTTTKQALPFHLTRKNTIKNAYFVVYVGALFFFAAYNNKIYCEYTANNIIKCSRSKGPRVEKGAQNTNTIYYTNEFFSPTKTFHSTLSLPHSFVCYANCTDLSFSHKLVKHHRLNWKSSAMKSF